MHNNYITLPVLFLMLSNHYPVTYANSAAIPALVALIIVAGALIRHFFNVRHADHAQVALVDLGGGARGAVAGLLGGDGVLARRARAARACRRCRSASR